MLNIEEPPWLWLTELENLLLLAQGRWMPYWMDGCLVGERDGRLVGFLVGRRVRISSREELQLVLLTFSPGFEHHRNFFVVVGNVVKMTPNPTSEMMEGVTKLGATEEALETFHTTVMSKHLTSYEDGHAENKDGHHFLSRHSIPINAEMCFQWGKVASQSGEIKRIETFLLQTAGDAGIDPRHKSSPQCSSTAWKAIHINFN